MVLPVGFGSVCAGALLAGQFASVALTGLRKGSRSGRRVVQTPIELTIIRPLAGLEPFSEATLRSTFELHDPSVRLLFCVAQSADPVVPLVRRIIAEYPGVDAELLIGNEHVSANPKLNNLIKGWQRTTSEWVAFVDSNVLLPQDAVARLLDCWDDGCGMVCSPPIGRDCDNLGAELEASFLNGYQARWQLAAGNIGYGFAQGKVMFFKRDLLVRAGGLASLASEPAEDAAATKVVRAAGLSVRLVDRPFGQPLGNRRVIDVWKRQLRWAQLRRATFPRFFYLEILSTAMTPLLLLALDAEAPLARIAPFYLAIWYGAELALAARCGWDVSFRSVLLAFARDVIIVPVWLIAIWRNTFEWQGHAMRVDDAHGDDARMAS